MLLYITTFLITIPLDMWSFHEVLRTTSCVIRLQNTCIISCLSRRYSMLLEIPGAIEAHNVYTYIDIYIVNISSIYRQIIVLVDRVII